MAAIIFINSFIIKLERNIQLGLSIYIRILQSDFTIVPNCL